MDILYLVNVDENNRKGLFTSTHEKLKVIINSGEVDNYKVYAINFYDIGLMKLIKKITNKPIRVKGLDSFESVSYTHLTLPTRGSKCRSRWSPYH